MKKIVPFTKDIKFNTKIYEITSISLEHNLTIEENNLVSGEFIISGEYKITDSSINSEPFIYGLPFDITLDTKYDMDRIKIDIDDFKFEIVNEEILRINIDVLIEGIEFVEIEEEKEISEEIKPDLVIDSRSNSEEEIEKEEVIAEEKVEAKEKVNEKIKQEEKIDNDEEEIDRFNIFENMLKKEDTTMNNDSSDLFLQKDENIVKVNKSEDFIDNEMNSIFNNFSEKDEKFVSYYVHIVRENDNIDTICLKYGVSVEKIKEYNNIDQIALGSKIIIPYIVNEAI